jgi:hypothetical protein
MPQQTQKSIVDILGLEALPPHEQEAYLDEVGSTILETSLVRFMSTLSPEAQHALEAYIETKPEPEVLMTHMLEHYKDFEAIISEAVLEYQEDVRALFGGE